MIDLEQIAEKYGIWALLVYVLLRDGLPILKNSFPVLDRFMTSRQEKENKELERRANIEERQILAIEIISKTLALVGERLDLLLSGQRAIMESLVEANKSLAVLLDRANIKKTPRTKTPPE